MHHINSIALFTVISTPRAQRLTPPSQMHVFFWGSPPKAVDQDIRCPFFPWADHARAQRTARWQQRMYVRSSADRPAWKSITVPWWWPLSQRCLLTSNPFAMGYCDRSTGQTHRRMQTHNLAAADVRTPIKTWPLERRLRQFSVSPDCFRHLGLDLLLEKTVKL